MADGGTSYLAIVSGVIGAGAYELRLTSDGGSNYVFTSGSLTNGFNTVVVAPGTYRTAVRNLQASLTFDLVQTTFVERGYQAIGLFGDTNSSLLPPQGTFRVMPDGGVAGMRSLVFFNGMVDTRQTAVTMQFDFTGDGVSDTAPIAFGESVTVDLPTTQTTVRVITPAGWLDFSIPTSSTDFPERSRGAIVVRGVRDTYDPALRSAVRGLSSFDAPLTFSSSATLPNPRLQMLNLAFVDAAGTKKDLYVGNQRVAADAGFGAVSEAFSIPPNTATSFFVQNTGTTWTGMGSVGSHTIPAGAVGLVVFIDGYQLSRAIDTRSTSFGSNLDNRSQELNVVQGYFAGTTATLHAGTLSGTNLSVFEGNINPTPFRSLEPTAFPASLPNLGIRENNTPIWRINGFSIANRLAWTYFSRLNSAGDRRFVRVSADWAPYALYRTDAVNVPCSQTTTACTPCTTTCACPAGVFGCN